jgi:D-3-phosphoglycerate dehydrogenase
VQTYQVVKPFLTLGEKLGSLVAQLAPKRNDRLVITYGGKAAQLPTDPITRAVLKGFLSLASGKEVNQVNVRSAAASLGLLVEEIKSSEATDFSEWLHVSVHSGEEKISAGGSVFGARYLPRIVRLFSQPVEIVPEGVIFLMNNKDRPGIVGYIGTLMGKHNVNIANMSLSRDAAGGMAWTVLNLDSVPPPALLQEIQKDPDISNIRVVKL